MAMDWKISWLFIVFGLPETPGIGGIERLMGTCSISCQLAKTIYANEGLWIPIAGKMEVSCGNRAAAVSGKLFAVGVDGRIRGWSDVSMPLR